LPKP